MRIKLAFILAFAFALALTPAAKGEACNHEWKYVNLDAQTHRATCALCGATQDRAHTLIASRIDATCREPAQMTYSCDICGYSATYYEGEKSTEHKWGEYELTRKSTCAKEGEETRTCAVCGRKETRALEKTEHVYGDWQPHDEKWHIKYCKVCSWAYKGTHRLDGGRVIAAATASSLGTAVYTCQVCGQEFTEFIDKDGAVSAQDGEDALGNGEKYLLVEEAALQADDAREIELPGGGIMEVYAKANCVVSLYANSETGAYAGLRVSSGAVEIELIPETEPSALNMGFLRVLDGASVSLRIWDMTGEVAISNANGMGIVIAQRKNAEGAVTALTRTQSENKTTQGSCIIYLSGDGALRFTGAQSGVQISLGDSATAVGSASWKYDQKTRKLTATAKDANGKFDGVSYYVFVKDIIAMGARDIAKAEGTIKASNDGDPWRLRVKFPNGDVYQSPLYAMNGSVATLADGTAFLTSKESELSDAEAKARHQEDEQSANAEAEPDAVIPTQAPASSAQTPVTPDESALFEAGEAPIISCQFLNMRYTVRVSALPDGWTISRICFVQVMDGDALAFRMENAYADSAEFSVSRQNSRFYATVTILNGQGETKDIEAGDFLLTADAPV